MHMHVIKSYLRKEVKNKEHIQALGYSGGKVGREKKKQVVGKALVLGLGGGT